MDERGGWARNRPEGCSDGTQCSGTRCSRSTARHASRASASILALALGFAGPARAQFADGPSVLTLLPISGTLEVGSDVTGSLVGDDYLAGGRRVRAYELTGAMGDPVIIDLVSEDFDAYLTMIGPDGVEVAADDDSGGACHARVSVFLEQAGTYRVVASSLSGETGSFTLHVDRRQGPPAAGDCGGGGVGGDEVMDVIESLEPEGTLSLDGVTMAEGELSAPDTQMTDGSYVEAWLVAGDPGQTVVVDLASRAFDTLLFVVEPEDGNYRTDDDSGGACNSRMVLTMGLEPHIVVVNSLSPDGSGPFTLRVSAQEGPEATGSCPGLSGP